MRTFIALELNDEVRQALAALQEQLRSRLRRARFTRPEGTHLTLKFLGDVEANRIGEISTALDQVAKQFQPLDLELEGLGAFPRLAQPRVLWVGLKTSSELARLQLDVEALIAPLGFPTEKRAFHGHLTLARLEGEPWSEELRGYFSGLRDLSDSKRIAAKEVVLFRSDLKPSGAVYTALYRGKFKEK